MIVVAIVAIIGLAWLTDRSSGWLMRGATFGTALGTIGLAVYTYVLANATQSSVAHSEQVLAVAREQAGALSQQVDVLQEELTEVRSQADASQRSAAAAQAMALEVAKARIDATAPLVDLRVTIRELRQKRDSNGRCDRPVQRETIGLVARAEDLMFEATLDFKVVNLGQGQAFIHFGRSVGTLRLANGREDPILMLPAGAEHDIEWRIEITGPQALEQFPVELTLSYYGIRHGEIADTTRWSSNLLLIRDDRGEFTPAEVGPLLGGGPAQVSREYPNLERAEEMAAARANIFGPRP